MKRKNDIRPPIDAIRPPIDAATSDVTGSHKASMVNKLTIGMLSFTGVGAVIAKIIAARKKKQRP